MSKIEWTDTTWNPTTGCSHAGDPACDHCYAVGSSEWLAGMGQERYIGLTVKRSDDTSHFNGEVRVHADALERPFTIKSHRKIFVNSMSDLFHARISFEFIAAVYGVMQHCSIHTFQILTKRYERARQFYEWIQNHADDHNTTVNAVALHYAQRFVPQESKFYRALTNNVDIDLSRGWPLSNVWLGMSAGTQRNLDDGWAQIEKCPAFIRFISFGPLIQPLRMDVHKILGEASYRELCRRHPHKGKTPADLKYNGPSSPDWIIVEGESNSRCPLDARLMHPEWVRYFRDTCESFRIPFFFKQWGEWAPWTEQLEKEHGGTIRYLGDDGMNSGDSTVISGADVVKMICVRKKGAGRVFDGRTHDEFPNVRKKVVA